MGTKTNVRAAGIHDLKAAAPVFIANHASVLPGPLDHFESYHWRRRHDTVRHDHPLDSYESNARFCATTERQYARGNAMIAGR